MDTVEKFVADLICKWLKVTDPAAVAVVEADVPKIVDGGMAIFEIVKAVRATTTKAK